MSEGWSEKVLVALHHAPEGANYEGSYEAITLGGVPGEVLNSASDRDSKEEALDKLARGLHALGFDGSIAIADSTELDRTERYEMQVD